MNIDGVLGAFTFILEKEVMGKNPYEKEENTISDRTKELSMKKKLLYHVLDISIESRK